MLRYVLVAMGGAVGAVARYAVTGLVHFVAGTSFPYGTLAVNAAGCMLVGAFMGATEARLVASPDVRVFLVVGVLGGFTAFSAFGYETETLLRQGAFRAAAVNVALNVGLAIGAVILGRGAARWALG